MHKTRLLYSLILSLFVAFPLLASDRLTVVIVVDGDVVMVLIVITMEITKTHFLTRR